MPLLRWSRAHRTALLLFGVVLLGVLPRLSHLERPFLLDLHAWRQADSAAFAENYLRGSWNPLDPAVDRQPCAAKSAPFGRVESELPIVAYLAVVPLKLLGSEHVSAGYLRGVSILVFVLGCFAFFACVRELGGDALDGLLTVAAFSAAPLGIFFTRSPQPDGPSLSVAIGCVWLLARYLNRGRARDAAALSGMLALLLLMKISNAYLGLVLAYLVLAERGPRAALRDWRLWAAAGLACAIAAAWYLHAHAQSWSFGVWSAVPRDEKFATVEVLSKPAKWHKLLARLRWDILSAGGCALVLLGLATRRQLRTTRVGACWLLVASIFVVITLSAQLRHIYYQLCIIPPAALLEAAGARWLLERAKLGAVVLAALVAVHGYITASVLWGESEHSSLEGPSFFTEDPLLREPIDALRARLPEGALFVSSERDPRLYWNSGHRGYFCDSKRTRDVLRCMQDVSDDLLLGARARAKLRLEPAFAANFHELWHSKYYSLYRRAPVSATPGS